MLSRVPALCILFPFLVYSVWVAATGGDFETVVAAFGANPWIVQVSVDLCIALGLVCVWMWRDARARGANPLPWVIATLFTGSVAPLAYLVFRPVDAASA